MVPAAAAANLSRLRQIVTAMRQIDTFGGARRSLGTLAGAALCAGLVVNPVRSASADRQTRSAVTRATVTARLDDSEGEVVATLKNAAAVPLEAWRLTFVYATRASASSAFSTTSDTF